MASERDSIATPGAYARDLARQLGVAGFWGWWVAQLGSLVPATPRAAWRRRRMRPMLAFDTGRAAVWLPVVRDGHIAMVEAAAIPLDGDPDDVAAAGRRALASLPGARSSGVPVTVALPPRTVLRKQITLPLAVEENARQVVGYDLDRHTPFKGDELYFDARVVSRDPAHGTLRVDLATARRNAVDPLLALAQSFGAAVAGITADPPEVGTSALNLLPPERRPEGAPWRRWQLWLPLGLLAAFALAATVLPVWQKREYAIDLGDRANRARAQAAVSETLRAELDRQVADYNFALERKFGFPPAVQILDDVSRLLPDDTWLTQLELRTSRGKELARELSLRGESVNAGRLVTLLEDSKLFTQAAPRSPTTKIQPGPGEIFDVGAQLKPLPPPTAPPLLVAATGPVQPVAPASAPGATPAPAAGTAEGSTPDGPGQGGAKPADKPSPAAVPDKGAAAVAPAAKPPTPVAAGAKAPTAAPAVPGAPAGPASAAPGAAAPPAPAAPAGPTSRGTPDAAAAGAPRAGAGP